MDHLAHYGVPGMKWGVRKTNPQQDLRDINKLYKKSAKKQNKAYKKYASRVGRAKNEKKRQKAFKKYSKKVAKINNKYTNKITKKSYSYAKQYYNINMTDINSAENVKRIGETLTNYMVDYVKANGG